MGKLTSMAMCEAHGVFVAGMTRGEGGSWVGRLRSGCVLLETRKRDGFEEEITSRDETLHITQSGFTMLN